MALQPKVITCRVLAEELRELMPAGTEIEIYELSLHIQPAKLAETLQKAVEAADGLYDPIYLGYGMCSKAVVGLVAQKSSMVVFKTDDCIGIFMGSMKAQREQAFRAPGSYFLTRGWIGNGSGSIFDEYTRLEARYGQERAMKVFKKLLIHYNRLTHILVPGAPDVEADRAFATAMAAKFGLDYVELQGTIQLLKDMVSGADNEDIIRVGPGEPITLEMMVSKELSQP